MKNDRPTHASLTDRGRRTTRNMATIALVLCAAIACSTTHRQPNPEDLLLHHIPVPPEYSWGKGNPHFDSGLSIWIQFYDNGWWQCVEDFAKSIDYAPTASDYAANGGGASVGGFASGYRDAKTRIEKIKQRFGRVKAQEILQKSLEMPPG